MENKQQKKVVKNSKSHDNGAKLIFDCHCGASV